METVSGGGFIVVKSVEMVVARLDEDQCSRSSCFLCIISSILNMMTFIPRNFYDHQN